MEKQRKKRPEREQYERTVRALAVLVIALLDTFMFKWFWDKYYSAGLWIEPFYNKGNIIIMVVYMLIFLLFMHVYGGMKIGQLKTTNVVFSQALSGLCANVFIYFIIVLLSRHLVAVVPMLVMTVIDVAVTAVFAWVFNKFYIHIFPARKLVMIYDEYSVEPLVSKMITRSDKYQIVKKLSIDVGQETLEQEILNSEGVVLNDLHSEARNHILKFCYTNRIRVYITPKVSDILIRNSETLHLFDTPLMLVRGSGMSWGQKFLKRLMDIVVSLIMIVVASPFMLIAAVLIKGYDRGPVLFKQKRLTVDRKEFYVYKFRSMIVDAEKDGVARLASANDSRITPVGKFIRATRLDELPQLFNILKGDMSLVGPRPERPEIAVEYEKEVPEFAYRLRVKAGLTGYAQIYGKYNTTAYDKLKLDLMYIEGYNVLLDLKLLVTTFKIMFMKDSTEGVSADQVTAMDSKQSEKQ